MKSRHSPFRAPGFSLIELLVVMVLIGALTAIGISTMGSTAANARRTATDEFTAAVEQARTAAITRRKPVILAIAAPRSSDTEQKSRFGLFEVDELPESGTSLEGKQLQRWTLMPDGVVFFGGKIKELRNLLDEDEVQLSWKDGQNQASVHALAFNARGGLVWPTGSDPVAIKIGSGAYQNGKPVALPNGGHNSLRVGRVVARPWKIE